MATKKSVQRYFTGFTTQDGVRNVYDIDLIKVDLMTAFQTRIGERVMRPDYGCKLWDYLMEPFTPFMRDQILKEALRICNLDSRLVVLNVEAFELDHGFRLEITLEYQPWKVVDTFSASFEQTDLTYFGADTNTTTNLIG